MRCSLTKWLWCMWQVQRTYHAKGLMFSQRLRFLEELRPFVSLRELERVAYPDAIFWITPSDVKRARHLAIDGRVDLLKVGDA